MEKLALITPGGSALGHYELTEEETEPGAIIRRPGQPDRRVVGRLWDDEAGGYYNILVVEHILDTWDLEPTEPGD